MPNELDDLTGQSFGLLTAVERAPNDKFGTVYWYCECRCGERVVRRANTLRAGKFFTCGKTECRFWEKVYIPEGDGCWEWTGAVKETGYGVLKIPGENRLIRAHVFSFELHYGPKQEDLWVLHRCDNRKCVRPDHLFLGTHEDNMADMAKKGRNRTDKVFLLKEARERLVCRYNQGGLSHSDLAAEFGISLSTVRRMLRRASSGGKLS